MSRLWLWPIVIGVLCAVGLIVGLISDGLGDLAAWTGLGLPVLTVISYSMRKSPSKRASAEAAA
jgi:hypothetical protein